MRLQESTWWPDGPVSERLWPPLSHAQGSLLCPAPSHVPQDYLHGCPFPERIHSIVFTILWHRAGLVIESYEENKHISFQRWYWGELIKDVFWLVSFMNSSSVNGEYIQPVFWRMCSSWAVTVLPTLSTGAWWVTAQSVIRRHHLAQRRCEEGEEPSSWSMSKPAQPPAC